MKSILFLVVLFLSVNLYAQFNYEKKLINGEDKWVLNGEKPKTSDIYDQLKINSLKEKLKRIKPGSETKTEGWERIYPQPTEKSISNIVSKDSFALCLTYNFDYYYDECKIFRTTDKGNSWVEIPAPVSVQLYHIRMSGDILYAIGFKMSNYLLSAVVYSSDDLGITWIQKYQLSECLPVDIFLMDSLNLVIPCFSYYDNMLSILHSDDGGNSWKTNLSTLTYDYLGSIFFTDHKYGWLTAVDEYTGSFLLKTSDGGISWDEIQTFPNSIIADILFTDTSKGICIGNTLGANEVYLTYDGGINWLYTASIQEYGNIRNFYALDPDNLYFILGYFEVKLYKSSDGGKIWSGIDLSVSPNYLIFENLNDAWLAGNGGMIRFTSNGGYNWINKSKTLIDPAVNDIFFTDEHSGWIATNNGYLLKSSDGGYNWNTSLHTDIFSFTDILFTTRNKGFTLSNKNDYYNNSGRLGRTTNGGNSWAYTAFDSVSLINIFFADSLNGWIVGNKKDVQPYITKTTNAGQTWKRQTKFDVYIIGGTDVPLNNCYFVDPDNGWAVGNYGIVVNTTNGGTNWKLKWGSYDPNNFWINMNITDVHFFDINRGYLVGNFNNWEINTPVFLKTSDGGNTWDTTRFESNYYYLNYNAKMYFVDSLTGYLFGTKSYYTSNGGNNWIPIGVEKVNSYSAYEHTIWAAGKEGRLYKYVGTPGSVFDEEISNKKEYYLSQNYPNPFNPTTKINLILKERGDVLLTVYDILGREVVILVNEEKEAGRHEILFNATGLASGIYYYTISISGTRETRKMIFLK
jgi:photosystem II stability/assembly factor-like uncharacterized protein